MARRRKVVDRREALHLLSNHIRRDELPPDTLVKLLTMYSELAGWEQAEPETDEPDVNKLVVLAERNRRESK